MDVLFVVDMSGSNQDHTQVMTDFILELGANLNIAWNKTHFAYFPFAYNYSALEGGDDMLVNKRIKALPDPTKEQVQDYLKAMINYKINNPGL